MVLTVRRVSAHPPLEVCVPAAAGGDGRSTAASRHGSCCTRTLERHLHQSAMDGARQAITSSPIFRRLQTAVAKTSAVQGLYETRHQ